MFETVIFDWDGTLADSRVAILYAFHRALSQIDADVGDQQIARLVGIGSAETFRQLLKACGKPFDEALISNLVQRKIQFEIEVGAEVKLFPGAMQLLQHLEGKVKLGLASMNNRAVIDHLLRTTGTKDFFAVTVTADEISRPKPNPEIFIKTAQKLNSTPEQSVVVEDSVFGLKAAKTANMACVAVAQGAYSLHELLEAGADLVVVSLQKSAEILNFILK